MPVALISGPSQTSCAVGLRSTRNWGFRNGPARVAPYRADVVSSEASMTHLVTFEKWEVASRHGDIIAIRG
jgi:hypothetical protein